MGHGSTGFTLQRVVVVGSGGAGKSYVAMEIASKLGLPIHHLDSYRTGRREPAWGDVQRQLIQKDSWVIDGNSFSTLGEQLGIADTVVFLDLPPVLCAFRVVRRCWRLRSAPVPDLPPDSHRVGGRFLAYVLCFRWRRRPRLLACLSGAGRGVHLIRLRSRQEVELFLQALGLRADADFSAA
jgi:hypothetical protein